MTVLLFRRTNEHVSCASVTSFIENNECRYFDKCPWRHHGLSGWEENTLQYTASLLLIVSHEYSGINLTKWIDSNDATFAVLSRLYGLCIQTRETATVFVFHHEAKKT